MAKRGRPRKIRIDVPQKLLEETIKERDHYMVQTRKLSDDLKMLGRACYQLEQDCKRADKKSAQLMEEWQEAQKLSEDRFLSNQTLAKQLVQAEDRIKDLLAEIRMYEHEHDTLRHIIIDAMRGYDR